MTALRSRTNLPPKDRDATSSALPTAEDGPSSSPSKPKAYGSDEDEGPSHLSLLDILRVLGGLFLLSSTLSYFITGNSILWGYRPALTRPAQLKAWLVSLRSPLYFASRFRPQANPSPAARSSQPHRSRIVYLQRHRPYYPHPPRRQRHHLRCLRLPALLRPRRQLLVLCGQGCDEVVCDGLF